MDRQRVYMCVSVLMSILCGNADVDSGDHMLLVCVCLCLFRCDGVLEDFW